MIIPVSALLRVQDKNPASGTRRRATGAQGGAERVRPCGWLADPKPIWHFYRHFIRPANTFRRSLIYLSCLPLVGLLAALPATAETEAPKNIRVCVQFIEMPHTALTELMSGKAQPGDVLHDKAMAMTKDGKAKLLESAMVMGRSGQKATIDTFRELIYPTEYNPPGYAPPHSTAQSTSAPPSILVHPHGL